MAAPKRGGFDDAALVDFLFRPIAFAPLVLEARRADRACHAPFALWLIDALRPRTVVSFGLSGGDMHCAFAQAVDALDHPARLFGFDAPEGDSPHGGRPLTDFAALRAHHDPRYGRFSCLLSAELHVATGHFADGEIDLLHWDGRGDRAETRRVFEAWRPKLAPGAIVLFHEIEVFGAADGPRRLFEGLISDRAHFRFGHGAGLGVLAIDEEGARGPMAPLFDARDTADGERVRRMFARLGAGFASRAAAFEAQADAAGLQKRIRGSETRAAELAERLRRAQDEVSKYAELKERYAARAALSEKRLGLLSERMKPHDPKAQQAQIRKLEALYRAEKTRSATLQADRRRLQTELTAAQADRRRLQTELTAAQKDIRRILESTAWKLGSMISAVAKTLTFRRSASHRGVGGPRALNNDVAETAGTSSKTQGAVTVGRDETGRAGAPFAVVLHFFHLDQWAGFAEALGRFPQPFDLIVTTPRDRLEQAEAWVRADFPGADIHGLANRGRDVAPFLSVLNSGRLDGYEAVLKLHTKSSGHLANGEAWRDEILASLAPSGEAASRVLAAFRENPRLGLVGPERQREAGDAGWGLNRRGYEALLEKMGVVGAAARLDYFQGTMFWFRPDALKRVKALGLEAADFDPEEGQFDGTLAHVLERAMPAAARADGFVAADMREIGAHRLNAPPVLRRLSKLNTHPSENASSLVARASIASPDFVREADLARLDTASSDRMQTVAVVILNRNGAPALDSCLRALAQRVRHPRWHVLLVDHASDDASDAIIDRWASRLDIRLVRAPGNFSYSASINRAAQIAEADALLFLNNDAVIRSDVVAQGVEALADEKAGVASFPLNDRDGASNHIGIRFDDADPSTHFRRPRNVAGDLDFDDRIAREPAVFAAVCFAAAMVRRAEFLAIGGLHEGFVYGYEDVDFCLGVTARLGKRSVCLNDAIGVLHDHGRTRAKDEDDRRRWMTCINMQTLMRRRGAQVRRARSLDLVRTGGQRFPGSPKVGFVVADPSRSHDRSDTQWARGLGAALTRQFGWESVLIPHGEALDVDGIDVLVHMHRMPTPRRLLRAKPDLIRAAWIRDQFDVWPDHPWVKDLDALFLAGPDALDRYEDVYRLPATVLAAAADAAITKSPRPEQAPDRDLDLIVVAHRKARPRPLEAVLDPSTCDLQSYLFGEGWAKHPRYASASEGVRARGDLGKLYARSRLVIDDPDDEAVMAGVLSPRVFQAAADGCVPFSRHPAMKRAFGDDVPIWTDRADFEAEAARLLSDEDRRAALAAGMAARVAADHTFDHRAETFMAALRSRVESGCRISIKTPRPPNRAPQYDEWDLRARAIQTALKARGHRVRVDSLQHYASPMTAGDDCVIVLRGGAPYAPREGQVTIAWLWGDMTAISDTELRAYDHVFVASALEADRLSRRLGERVEALYPGLGASAFARAAVEDAPPGRDGALVLGRGADARAALKAAGVPHAAYGPARGDDPDAFAGEFLAPALRADLFASARLTVLDHGGVDVERGFLDPHVFEAGLHGAVVAAKEAPGLRDVFGEAVPVWSGPEDLRALFDRFADADARARQAAAFAEAAASFAPDRIAGRIDEVVRRLVDAAAAGPIDPPLVDRRGQAINFDGLVSSDALFGYDAPERRKSGDWTMRRHRMTKGAS